MIIAANYAFLAYDLLTAIRDTKKLAFRQRPPHPYPLLIVAGYWLISCAANSRVSVVRPAGITIALTPFPIGTEPEAITTTEKVARILNTEVRTIPYVYTAPNSTHAPRPSPRLRTGEKL